MAILKGLFRGGNEEKDATRTLDHPKDLKPGDIVKFGFAAQDGISNQSFRVVDVNALDLGGERHKKAVFALEGPEARLRLAVVQTDQGERLEIGRSVLPEDVEQVFDVDAFIDLLDPDTGVNHVLERTGEPGHLAGWSASVYRQEAGHNAYYFRGDYRSRLLPEDADAGDAFSYYLLVSDDRKFGLEAQVYDGGRTEVFLLAYLPVSKIEELWPAAE